MKAFFLLIVLANIFVALWEYRYGHTFSRQQTTSAEQSDVGLEKIMLVGEVAPALPDKTAHPEQKEKPEDSSKPQEKQDGTVGTAQ